MADYTITLADVKWASKEYQRVAPRDLFYRAACELVASASNGAGSLSQAEALAVLLKTWNGSYYRYHEKFDEAHFAMIESLLLDESATLAKCQNRTIDDLSDQDKLEIPRLFERFEAVLGPVGSSKALHLLSPKLFPLWDDAIARAYRLSLGKRGTNGDRYWRFMLISREQCQRLKDADPACDRPLKMVDEYNYCRHTKRLQA